MTPFFSPVRVGIIGCGNISNAYFQGLRPYGDFVAITACADLDIERASAKAAEHAVSKALSVEELLQDPDIDIVLNLTVPSVHAAVNLAALRAGKNAYCEKPFSLNTAEGKEVLDEAKRRGLRVGCAPDTVLGGGIQTCRNLVEEGAIGTPIAAVANMLCHGHESWHPSPEFYYQEGGGPLFDMGPYYLSSLLNIIGPVESVSALAQTTFKERLITSQPLNGKRIEVQTPTHFSGVLKFEGGASASVNMSFDVWAHHLPILEIYGTEGTLSCPDPNNFGGVVQLWKKGTGWEPVPLTHNDEVRRGFGLADMAKAIQDGRPHRMSGEMGLHCVEVMEAFELSSRTRRSIDIISRFDKPAALPAGLRLGELD